MNTEENRDPILCQEFVRIATDVLSHLPNIPCEWSVDADEDHCILYFPKKSSDGFDITVEVFPDEIIIDADGPQFHFDLMKPPKEMVDEALGFVRDLLSPDMRIVEKCVNGNPYKWLLQVLQGETWHTEQIVGLFFRGFWGRRSERILTNNVLPGRLNNSDS